MFETIAALIPRDPAYPERTRKLDLLRRVLDGTLYEVLPFEFHEERGPGGEYIPLRNRKPSVRSNLCRIVVDDSVALLFSEGRFPALDSPNREVRSFLGAIARETRLNEVMIDAALRGSVGSVAILMRVLSNRIYFSVLESLYLQPAWDVDAPDTLESVTERYKVRGFSLAERGYDVPDVAAEYWFVRRWDKWREIWYHPWPISEANARLTVDKARSVEHNLGFVPIVWVKNLPGPSSTGDLIDGASTFRPAIESMIEIDYQLSQAGRGLKYSSDPTLLIKEPVARDGEFIKGGGNALVVSEKGDAKLLEIGGSATSAVIEYVRFLRELTLEAIHGNRADPQRLSAPTSGRALELMSQGLISLADKLRISYGEGALLPLARMVLRAAQVYPLQVGGAPIPKLDANAPVSLIWPRWFPPSAQDRLADAQALATLSKAGHLSGETAVKAIRDFYDISDLTLELRNIEAEGDTA